MMKLMRRFALSAVLLLGGMTEAVAQDATGGEAAAAATPVVGSATTEAAGFDYWVLLLSWSPEYCRLKPSDQECKAVRGYREPYGFVVHGVRPHFEVGKPQKCIEKPDELSDELVDRAMMLMPSPQLVRSEWRRHGTCSGLSAEEYFIFAERAARRIEIPPEYRSPEDYIDTDLDTVKRKFLELNPELTDDSIALRCSRRWLKEVRVCFNTEMQPRACGRDIDDRCRAGKISMRPLRVLPTKNK